jgi:hypothetical protein
MIFNILHVMFLAAIMMPQRFLPLRWLIDRLMVLYLKVYIIMHDAHIPFHITPLLMAQQLGDHWLSPVPSKI